MGDLIADVVGEDGRPLLFAELFREEEDEEEGNKKTATEILAIVERDLKLIAPVTAWCSAVVASIVAVLLLLLLLL